MGGFIDLTGKKFGRLKVLCRSNVGGHHIKWLCDCECGNQKIVAGILLKSENTKSCGCLRKEVVSKRFSKHKKTKTKIYKIWATMRNRCSNPKHEKYKFYGAKGIKVCRRWMKFENFYKDMGDRPTPKHSIDRIDGEKGYNPENCRWATITEQSRNKIDNVWLEIDGIRAIKTDMCRWLGISHQLLGYYVKKYGMSNEKAAEYLFVKKTAA